MLRRKTSKETLAAPGAVRLGECRKCAKADAVCSVQIEWTKPLVNLCALCGTLMVTM